MEIFIQDLRYGIRMLLNSPGFAAVAVLTLALGIGSTTAVFSVVDRILFRSLPYPREDRLVSLGMFAPIAPHEFLFPETYFKWRQHQTPFEAISSWTGIIDCDLTEANAIRLSCAQVESTFISTLGIQPVLGRNFTKEEDQPNTPKVVLVSYGLWRGRFAGDPGVIGKTVSLDGQPARVVGVLPRDFELPTLARADLLIPQRLNEATERTGRLLWTLARLKTGVTAAQAEGALQPLFQQSLDFAPPEARKEIRLRVRSLRDRQVRDVQLASWILLSSVLAVLLIACANVANLLLARGVNRQLELAIRAALGAGRARLIRQALTESLLLGLFGGMVGCALAHWLLRLFVAIAPDGIRRLQQAGLDLHVLLFTLGGSLLSGLLFGLAPTFQSPGPEVLAGSRALGSARSLFRHSLVSAQIAGSLILLTGASLLLRSLWNLQNVPLGVQTESILTAQIVLSQQHYYFDAARELAFFEELEVRFRRIPGISALAISDSLPPSGPTRSGPLFPIEVEGRLRPSEGTGGMVVWRSVTPEYFSALGIPILRGRGFREEDRSSNERVVILSDLLARRLFPNEDPLGKRVGSEIVIGIVGNVKNSGLADQDDPEEYSLRRHTPHIFNGWHPEAQRRASIAIRSPMNPKVLADWVRAEIRVLDPTLPVTIDTMKQRVSKLAERPRFNAVLLGLFAGMGVLLAAIGLYGVVSFLVVQRTQEIGVRMALGASPGEITRLVLSHAARWTLAGALLGLVGSFFATRILRSLLFQIPERDPWTLGAALVLLLTVALLAAWIPSRRAALVDPMIALRHE